MPLALKTFESSLFMLTPRLQQPHDPDLAKSWVDTVSDGATVAPSCHRFAVTFLIIN